MQYYEDRLTRSIYSGPELQRLIEEGAVPRPQVARRFRTVPPPGCRVLDEAEAVARRAGSQRA